MRIALNRPKGPGAGWVRAVIGIPVSIVLLAVTASRVQFDLLADGWASVSIALVLLAAGISVLEVSIRAVRWRVLLAPFAPVSFGTSLGYLSMGHLANTVLPARLGDVTRALLTGTQLQASRVSVLGTIAVERIADAGLLALALALGVWLGFSGGAGTLASLLLVAGSVVVVGGLATLVLGHRTVAGTRLGGFVRRHSGRFLAGAAALRRPRSALRVVVLTVAAFALAILIFAVVAEAVGLSLPVWQSALVIAAVTLSTAIPSGPASIGTYEFVGMAVMTSMGYPAETSLLSVALVHIVATVPAALMGLASMWWLGVRIPGRAPVARAGSAG